MFQVVKAADSAVQLRLPSLVDMSSKAAKTPEVRAIRQASDAELEREDGRRRVQLARLRSLQQVGLTAEEVVDVVSVSAETRAVRFPYDRARLDTIADTVAICAANIVAETGQ